MPHGGREQVDERERQHELPGEVHELIHAQARQRAPRPDEQHDQPEQFHEEPRPGRDEIERGKRGLPAAEEQRDAESAHGEEAEVFRQKEQREFESGVFGEIAGHQFGFAFRQVERRAVRLGVGGDHEQDKTGEAPRREHKPIRQPATPCPACASTILTGESVPVIMTTVTVERMSGIS